MVETWTRSIGHLLRVGGKDVLVSVREEYSSESPEIPVRVTVVGPDGLKTEGDPSTAWREMLELLGIESPEPPVVEAAETPMNAFGCENREMNLDPTAQVGERQASAAAVPVIAEILPPISAATSSARSTRAAFIDATELDAIDSIEEEIASHDELEDDEQEDDQEEEERMAAKDPALNPNILQESMIRLLNSRVYSDDPPLEITPELVAEIPHLSCTQEAADFIGDLDENIQLTEMQGDAAERAERLRRLKRANRARRCKHVKFNGESCGSPALRGKQYCHFHAETHAPTLELPLIEDEHSLRVAFARLAHQVAANKIAPPQAKVLLQILESAGRSLASDAG